MAMVMTSPSGPAVRPAPTATATRATRTAAAPTETYTTGATRTWRSTLVHLARAGGEKGGGGSEAGAAPHTRDGVAYTVYVRTVRLQGWPGSLGFVGGLVNGNDTIVVCPAGNDSTATQPPAPPRFCLRALKHTRTHLYIVTLDSQPRPSASPASSSFCSGTPSAAAPPLSTDTTIRVSVCCCDFQK